MHADSVGNEDSKSFLRSWSAVSHEPCRLSVVCVTNAPVKRKACYEIETKISHYIRFAGRAQDNIAPRFLPVPELIRGLYEICFVSASSFCISGKSLFIIKSIEELII